LPIYPEWPPGAEETELVGRFFFAELGAFFSLLSTEAFADLFNSFLLSASNSRSFRSKFLEELRAFSSPALAFFSCS
jgi:hypothetical protein